MNVDNVHSAEQVAIAIKAVENRQFKMDDGIPSDEKISEIILDALKFYQYNGLGVNVDEFV